MTDAQWQEQKRQMEGMLVSGWKGAVDSVDEGGFLAHGYSMRIEVDGGCDVLFTIADKETALKYSIGQTVTVTGQISGYSELFDSLTVFLDDDPVVTDMLATTRTKTATPRPVVIAVATQSQNAEPQITGEVQVNTLNVREGPGTTFRILTVLKKGNKPQVCGQNADGTWYQIRLEDGREGWISSTLVRLEGRGTPQVVTDLSQTTPAVPHDMAESKPPASATSALPPDLVVPQCSEMLATQKGMTDAQWYNYRENLKGKWVVDWSGRIRDVNGKGPYSVWVDVISGCDLNFSIVDQAAALALSAGQQVKVTGQIDYSTDFLGFTIFLEDYSVTIR